MTCSLKKHFGFDNFKGNQKAIIQNLLDGRDTFVLMPTGGGKSLCYQLPALLMEGTAVIISPLIALMKNQVDAMRNFSEEDGIAHFLNSSLTRSAIDVVKEDVLSGKTKMLYVAPEFRKSRAAYMLVKGFINWATLMGASRIQCGTTTGVESAGCIRLYKHFGFTEYGTILDLELKA